MRAKGIKMMITGAHSQPLHMMQKSGFLDKMGAEFVLENIDQALEKSREILAKQEKESSQTTDSNK